MTENKTTPWLTPDWVQSGVDALREMLDADPGTKRQMIEFLQAEGFWEPEMGWETARARFNACLNPQRPEYFKVYEVWALSKRFERHHLFLAMAHDLGYEVRRRPTAERKMELLERLVVAMERAGYEREAIAAEVDRINTEPPERRMDPSVRAGAGRFSVPADAAEQTRALGF